MSDRYSWAGFARLGLLTPQEARWLEAIAPQRAQPPGRPVLAARALTPQEMLAA